MASQKAEEASLSSTIASQKAELECQKKKLELVNKQVETTLNSQIGLTSQLAVIESAVEKLEKQRSKLEESSALVQPTLEQLDSMIERGKGAKEQLKMLKKEVAVDEKEVGKMEKHLEKAKVASNNFMERCVTAVIRRSEEAAMWHKPGCDTEDDCFECTKSIGGKTVVQCERCGCWLCEKCGNLDPANLPGPKDVFLCPDSICQVVTVTQLRKAKASNSTNK